MLVWIPPVCHQCKQDNTHCVSGGDRTRRALLQLVSHHADQLTGLTGATSAPGARVVSISADAPSTS
jgi:hypothetical protein